MAYDTEELKKAALDAIINEGLITIEAVCDFIGINKTTFYTHKLNEVDEIKTAQLLEKRSLKRRAYLCLQDAMEQDRSVAAANSIIKLCGNQDERDALNGKVTAEVNFTTHSDLLDELEN